MALTGGRSAARIVTPSRSLRAIVFTPLTLRR
jgi:hypothetical protein